jgi:hypothetical protein
VHQRLTATLTAVLTVALVALFLGHLGDPGALLATRDIPVFHLPLRSALQHVAELGPPTWNPLIHGGQPILSNPNYAAFYPATWLMMLMPVHTSISLIVLLHAAIALAGARRFALHLGCSEGPAMMAGIGFAFSGAALATTSLLTTFCGLAWMPWILYGCDRWLSQETRELLSRRTFLPVTAFALQILAGEPVIVLTTGLAAALLALAAPQRGLRTVRLALICTLSILVAAAQLLPASARVRDSPRAAGLEADAVLEWSSPPQRALELLWPRAWGDPMRVDEDLYFGWSLHDRQFPYLYSIYPGQLILLLAFAGLIRWRVRYRGAWLAMIASGFFLATGAYNPIMRWLGEVAPLLSQIRFPEKFLLLTTTAIVFCAALGWQRVLDSRKSDETPLEDFPLALAGLIAVVNTIFLVVLWQRPDVGEWFARVNAAMPLSSETQQRAVSFFRHELLVALGVSLFSGLVFALHRRRATSLRVLIPLTLIILTADLWTYNHSLTPTVPASAVLTPPTAIATLDPKGQRIFTDRSFVSAEPLTLKSSRPGPSTLWSHVGRANPYLATLWNLRYAIHADFDLMTTTPARDAMGALGAAWGDGEAVQRILGAWSVYYLISNRPLTAILGDRLVGGEPPLITTTPHPSYQEPYRFERVVHLHPDLEQAVAADRATRFSEPHWVTEAEPQRLLHLSPANELLEIEARPSHLGLTYRARDRAALTIARTYSTGWSATVDGKPLPIRRTSLGMMGVLVPAGEHSLELDYHEPTLLPGLAISVSTLLALVFAPILRSRLLRRG